MRWERKKGIVRWSYRAPHMSNLWAASEIALSPQRGGSLSPIRQSAQDTG